MSENPKKSTKASAKKSRPAKKKAPSASLETEPLMTFESLAYDTSQTRRNKTSTIRRTDRFKNIEDGLVPYSYYSSPYSTGTGNSDIDIRDAVTLCQKAYYNFAQFRNVIDLMTEFSVGQLFFEGDNKKSKKFFEEFFEKINIFSLQDRFYREYFRSGNIFLYRFEGKLEEKDLKKVAKAYGASLSLLTEGKLPTKYIFLNPADIRMTGTASFYKAEYSKILSPYEIQRIKNPLTEEDETLRRGLDQETLKKIDSGSSKMITFPLDTEKLVSIFYKKQDYEPFAVPMGFPVLADLNFKDELKKMDMAIARTMQQAILLVTMGTDPDKGGVNQKNLTAMQKLFENQSVGRVLIADYTTKAEFVVPRIAELMNPQKYEVFDKDINMGLNNILVGGEKFANQSNKVEVFLARLEAARQTFLQTFLVPEIKRIAKSMGFRSYPKPRLSEISLKDDNLKDKIYNRLYELGVLTPEELVEALQSNRLPRKQDSLQSQKDFIKDKREGLYEPIMKTASDDGGRPEDTSGVPQQTQEVSPIGDGEQSKAKNFSLSKIKENMILAQKLSTEVSKRLRKIHGIKRFSNKQKGIADSICEIIIANEPPSNWLKSVEKYCEKPIDHNPERVKRIQNIAYEHQLDTYLASILASSIKE